MAEQSHWNFDDIILHNMRWNSIVFGTVKSIMPSIKEQEIAPAPTTPAPPREKSSHLFNVHCLPAEIVRHHDELYDYERSTVRYGKRFTFEAGVIDSSDLELVIWTARGDIAEASILFPKDGGRRWWKVVSITPHGVGYRIRSEISDEQPSFD